jgi:hypothetical protein
MKFQKGYILSEEHKQKMIAANRLRKGEKRSESARRRMSEAHKGKSLPEEQKRKIGESNKGHIVSEETRQKISIANTGHKGKMVSKEDRAKLRIHWLGENNTNWKGGISPISKLIRKSAKYIEWRQKCFIRDSFSCQKCGANHSGDLNVHHKKSFAVLLRDAIKRMPLFSPNDAAMLYAPLWDINNGETLCEKCHRATKHEYQHEPLLAVA